MAMWRLADGDSLALNEIMERWKVPLTSYLFRQLSNQHDAVDIAQETFVRVYEQRLRYRPEGKFSVWLFEIASNLCRNRIRWRIRHPTISLELESNSSGNDEIDLQPAGSDALIKKEQAHAVQAAIAELSEDLRTALVLFEYEEMSYDEIAQVMHCTRKAVETRIYRARRQLETCLRKWL
ncbi:MAG: RNA polymerase sigma factor [Candidatus Methylacidiphilales bacterium]